VEHFRKNKKGFTLIELLIAMTIFVVFLGVVVSSYASIIKSQRDTNDYRRIYSEGRTVFEKVVDEVRNGVLLFPDQNVGLDKSTLRLISNESGEIVQFKFYPEEGKLKIKEGFEEAYYLNSDDVKIEDFQFHIYPDRDPYASENVSFDYLQFQPQVTIFAEFEEGIPFQTTISSRTYNAVPQAAYYPDLNE